MDNQKTSKIPSLILEATEACLSNLPDIHNSQESIQCLRTLIILERLLDSLRITMSDGYEQSQSEAYRKRENTVREKLISYAKSLDKTDVIKVVNEFKDNPDYKTYVMSEIKVGIPELDSKEETYFLDEWKKRHPQS